MKNRIPSFDEFINEAALTKTDNIEEFKKQLPQVFKVEEYLDVYYKYMSPFNKECLYNEVMKFDAKLDLTKIFVSKSAYVKNSRDAYNKGYGGTDKVKDLESEYNEFLANNPKGLLKFTVSLQGADKVYKNLAKAIIASIGAQRAAEICFYSAWNNANSSYDRWLVMDDYYQNTTAKIWSDKSEIYNAVSRGFMSAGKNIVNSPLREYALSLYKK